jgi:hypothetical protein
VSSKDKDTAATAETVDVSPKTVAKATAAPKHSKERLLGFECFKNRRDLLNALLADDKEYTIEEANSLIDNFMKG